MLVERSGLLKIRQGDDCRNFAPET